jgi:hypothetical protein
MMMLPVFRIFIVLNSFIWVLMDIKGIWKSKQ